MEAKNGPGLLSEKVAQMATMVPLSLFQINLSCEKSNIGGTYQES